MSNSSELLQKIKYSRNPVVPVILAGGVGSRLWPLSRENHPKPFIKLEDGQSLIQKTYLRAIGLGDIGEVITVINRELFFYTKDELEALSISDIFNAFLLEPFGRNSSAAIAIAAHYIKEKYGDATTLLVLPSDHLIENQSAFNNAVQSAIAFAEQDRLVTFGIKPDSPKTAYGYIETEGNEVKSFIEKPNLELAQRYLAAGNYYWNSGMFCMKVASLLKEMELYCPDIFADTMSSFKNARRATAKTRLQLEIDAQTFEKVRDISIDYSIFEKSKKVSFVSCDMGWADIGSWVEFAELYPEDLAHNHIYGETVLEDVHNCFIHTEYRLVAGIGLKDLIIVDTPDALLVAHKKDAQGVRQIVSQLKVNGHKSYKIFPTIYRPWGNYTVLQEGLGFKLKRIEVKPGAALSLQTHKYRSEHWIVVKGMARIVNGAKVLELQHNQSTYIPAGHKHRLENSGKEILVLIEVQCGSYLGEDDIVRYADTYGRHLVDLC